MLTEARRALRHRLDDLDREVLACRRRAQEVDCPDLADALSSIRADLAPAIHDFVGFVGGS